MEIQPPSCWLILVSVSEACWRVVEESDKPPRFGRVIVITIVTFVPGRVSEGGLRLQMLKVFCFRRVPSWCCQPETDGHAAIPRLQREFLGLTCHDHQIVSRAFLDLCIDRSCGHPLKRLTSCEIRCGMAMQSLGLM